MNKYLPGVFLSLFVLLCVFTPLKGQIVLSGTSYFQSFDTIGIAGLPAGITIRTGATSISNGTAASFSNAAVAWNNTSGAFKNFASANGLNASSSSTEQNNSTDRALGLRQTSSFGDPGGAFVIQLENTTNFQSFSLGFSLQSLDNTSPRTTTWLVDYGIGVSPATFTAVTTSPATLITGNSQFANTTVTVNFGNALDNKSQNVWIRIVTLSATTGSGNRASTGIDDLSLSFSSFGDVTPPMIQTLSPVHNSTNVPVYIPLRIKFSEAIQKGTGIITVKNITDNTQQNIDVTTAAVTVSNDTAAIAATLLSSKQYAVIIPAGIFKDLAGNNFSGITEGNWNFTTAAPDVTPPGVNGFVPNSGATNVSLAPVFKIIFDEPVQTGNNLILVNRFSDNSTVFSVNAQAGASTNGNEGIIPITSLQPNTLYYVQVLTGAFKDLAGNNFSGFIDNTVWQFVTGSGIILYNYDFNTCVAYGIPGSGWMQYSFTGDSIWKCTSFGYNNTNGAQMSGFVNPAGPAVNEDWLISPAMNLTAYNIPVLSFRARTKFPGNRIELLASTAYTGSGNPTAVAWTPVSVMLPQENSDAWALVDSINLFNFKTMNTYIAIKYTSTSTAAARWTIDDVDIRNATTAPMPAVLVTNPVINFDNISAGTASNSRSFQFVAVNFVNNLVIDAPAFFQVSKDNVTFSNSILFDPDDLSKGYKTAYIRYTPANANSVSNGFLNFNSLNGYNAGKIEVTGNSYPASATLDIVNWNLEWFGSTTNGPADDNLQQANVKRVMDSLQADIYALCEIVDTTRLMNLANSLGGYAYKISDYCSNAPDLSDPDYVTGQKLAFIYKTSVVTNVKVRGMLKASAVANSNWASGRVPFLMEADIVNGTATKKYQFIVIHGKAGSTNSDYQRRKDGAKELKDTLDAQFSAANVMIIGDYNDDLDSTISTGIAPPRLSSYDDIVKDSIDIDSYKSLTMPLSLAGLRSTISNPEVIDHVVVSNELTADVILRSARLVRDVETWITSYENTTTDHYPVMSRTLMPAAITGVTNIPPNAIQLKLMPNPVKTELTFSFKPAAGDVQIDIIDINGRLVKRIPSYRSASVNQTRTINLEALTAGVYFLKIGNNQRLITQKFVKL